MKGKTALPDPFPITAEMRAYADKNMPTLDIDYYHDEFCDHWYSNGQMKKSWPATWRNWMRRTDRGQAPGLYGPDDNRIVRKRPKPVPQSEMQLAEPTDMERYLQRKDALASEAIGLGMHLITANRATTAELEEFIQQARTAEGD